MTPGAILWKQIEEFDLDHPISEYGFSTRLARENNWTINFTTGAILEYKKFMYLAATADFMVSPSEIIDVVWHQHIIFTQSYTDFCNTLGKRIEHVPSTRNRQEFEIFKTAKEQTNKSYVEIFGEQPRQYWDYADMYQPLFLDKARIKVGNVMLIGICAFLVLMFPAYFFLKPIYVKIDNPYFIFGYVFLAGITVLLLEWYNRAELWKKVNEWNRDSFVFNLTPMELVFLSKENLSNVIHGSINQMIEENKISVLPGYKLKVNDFIPHTASEFSVVQALRKPGNVYYPLLVRELKSKPAFTNFPVAIHAFRKYFNKSGFYVRLYTFNFTILSIILLLGFERWLTGIARDKPVGILTALLFFYFVQLILHLNRIPEYFTREVLPKFYRKEIIPGSNRLITGEWKFFLVGNLGLSRLFFPLVKYVERREAGTNGTSGGSSGGSCGSSCGSSCGGCGGCGGG